MIDGRELLIEIGRKHNRSLTRLCYFLVCVILVESTAFMLFLYHCRHH